MFPQRRQNNNVEMNCKGQVGTFADIGLFWHSVNLRIVDLARYAVLSNVKIELSKHKLYNKKNKKNSQF